MHAAERLEVALLLCAANGLEARDLIAYSSARLVVSRVAMKTRHQHIAPIIERLNQWVKTRHAT